MSDIDRMSDERLQQIQQRADAATQGPWISTKAHGNCDGLESIIDTHDINEAQFEIYGFASSSELNASFIAHSRADIPDLLAEVRWQREEFNEFTEAAAKVCVAANRMLECWPEGDDNVKQFLWKQLHQANQELFIILDKRKLYPYPSVSQKPAAEASNE